MLFAYSEFEFKKRQNHVANRLVGNLHHNKVTVGLSHISQFWNGKLYSDVSYTNGLNWFNANKLAYDTKGKRLYVLFQRHSTGINRLNYLNEMRVIKCVLVDSIVLTVCIRIINFYW
ncbi:LspB protein [Actinobacillus equuli]|nr:LspB protein [Actinobacillus equuli]